MKRQTATVANELSAAEIRIRSLTVTAGTRTLLRDASAVIPAGKITVIIGASGVGKSVLLRIIAGLIDRNHAAIHYQGEVEIAGHGPDHEAIGVVFQSFALFDELTPRANVTIARDLGGQRSSGIDVESMLSELGIPTHVPTSQLSGGQRQRLAIARTLAFNPPAILYDEPTSGLDPATGGQVANLIRSTHQRYQKTSVIVTHDYNTLLPIADRILVLDSSQQTLVEIARADVPSMLERLKPQPASAAEGGAAQPIPWAFRARMRLAKLMSTTTRAVEATLLGLWALIPLWRNPKWGLRYFAHYLRLVVGPTAWFYLAIAGIITGFVTTHFIFQYLPYAVYIEPLLVDDLLSAMGFTMYRIFVPVLSTVLIAARCGAAVAADVGSKQYGNQIDALQSLGAQPRSYLLTPILWSFIIGTPLLTLLAFVFARLVSLIAFVASHPQYGPDFWSVNFHYALTQSNTMFYRGTYWLISKLITCGFGIAIISYFFSRRPKYSSTDVSDTVTNSIFWSTLYVLVVHFGFAFYEFNPLDVKN